LRNTLVKKLVSEVVSKVMGEVVVNVSGWHSNGEKTQVLKGKK
jgi:hypothetical protein